MSNAALISLQTRNKALVQENQRLRQQIVIYGRSVKKLVLENRRLKGTARQALSETEWKQYRQRLVGQSSDVLRPEMEL
jgi:hypothetical protein